MRKTVKGVVAVILSAGFLWGAAHLLAELRGYEDAEKNTHMARDLALPETGSALPTEQPAPEALPPTETTELPTEETQPVTKELPMDAPALFLQQVDIAALQQVNPEVLGWIYIPDTAVSYPLLQAEDNNKYLHYAWDGTPNGSGSIFLERRNARDMTDFNTIIYGHHMANGTMFQPLIGYRDAEFMERNPYVYVVSGDGIFRYRIFSAYEAPIDSHTYRLVFRDDGEKMSAVEYYLQGREDMVLGTEDRILTLSTCTGMGDYSVRWVVQGVLDTAWQK